MFSWIRVEAEDDGGSLEYGTDLFADGQAEVFDAVVRDDGADRLAAAVHGQDDFRIDRAVVDAHDFAPQMVARCSSHLGIGEQ